jgi:hypoxanthine phosphoribosyltransferase
MHGPHALDVVVSSDELVGRVRALAGEIRRDAGADMPVHFVAVLKGGFMFLADLMRADPGPCTCDFLAVSSYGSERVSSGQVQLTKDLDHSIEDRYVVLVEDIVDTGRTLTYLQALLATRRPRVLKTVALLAKPGARVSGVVLDYRGFEISDRFVVGYGLDWDEQYRQLSFVAALP